MSCSETLSSSAFSTYPACIHVLLLVKVGVIYPILWGSIFMGVFMGVNESFISSVG